MKTEKLEIEKTSEVSLHFFFIYENTGLGSFFYLCLLEGAVEGSGLLATLPTLATASNQSTKGPAIK